LAIADGRGIVRDAMPHDRNVHRRGTIRLPNWDYRERGAYFVTICTHERAPLFEDERFAAIVTRAWLRSVNADTRIDWGDFVLMPNHIHGIIWLPYTNAVGAQRRPMSPDRSQHPQSSDSSERTSRHGAAPLRPATTKTMVLPGSLGAVVRAYKSFTANRINRVRGTPGAPVWQRNYYERVIRDEREVEAVRTYILDNPRMWAEDP
jgi:REP element-mobilizing transposase RayT